MAGRSSVSTVLKITIPILAFAAIILYFFVFTGVIVINSQRPTEVTIEIDGVVIGSTPLKQRIRAGTHQIRAYKEGFETWRGQVKVGGYSPTVISVKMRFLIRSEPSGAEVIMDGEYIGETEMAIDLKPGIHAFEFRMDGYQSAKFRASIPENVNEPLPVATLSPAGEPPSEEVWQIEEPSPPEYGSIQVTSTPDAQVYIDGVWQGETPLTIEEVLVGSYVLMLSREGYRDLRRTVYVNKDETTRFAGELKPLSQNE
jgi:hypothetical protein